MGKLTIEYGPDDLLSDMQEASEEHWSAGWMRELERRLLELDREHWLARYTAAGGTWTHNPVYTPSSRTEPLWRRWIPAESEEYSTLLLLTATPQPRL